MASDNPIISIDPRKNRIRIYKRTIRLFEIPKYVQILVIPKIQLLLYSVWILVRLINTTVFNGKSSRIAIVMRYTVHSL